MATTTGRSETHHWPPAGANCTQGCKINNTKHNDAYWGAISLVGVIFFSRDIADIINIINA
ncbi:MAG: hypothetical protein LUG93_13925 [Lachnospiraceae bacterium]|nr:hypothetical protein [Lachnospiraceae bacterium]